MSEAAKKKGSPKKHYGVVCARGGGGRFLPKTAAVAPAPAVGAADRDRKHKTLSTERAVFELGVGLAEQATTPVAGVPPVTVTPHDRRICEDCSVRPATFGFTTGRARWCGKCSESHPRAELHIAHEECSVAPGVAAVAPTAWVVTEVLGMREHETKGAQYLLRWEDLDAFPEATWTSVNHCVGCQDLLDGFLAEQAPKRRKSSTVAYSPAKVCATPQTASRTGAEAAAPESTAEAAPAGRCPGVPFDELIDSVHKFAVCPACRQHGVFSALRFHSFTPQAHEVHVCCCAPPPDSGPLFLGPAQQYIWSVMHNPRAAVDPG